MSEIVHSLLDATFAFAGEQVLHGAITRRLAIIVEEIVTNVLCHGADGRPITLTLHLRRDESGLFVTLEDDSTPFDPRGARLRDMPNPDRGGGVGLALVKAWSDIVSYDRDSTRNRLILHLHPSGDAEPGTPS